MESPDVIYTVRTTKNGGFFDTEYVQTSYPEHESVYHHSRIVEALRRENEELKEKYQETDTLYWQQVREIAELKAKLDKAKDALRFYAFRERYHGTDNIVFNGFKEKQIAEDRGELARTTLEEIK